MRTVGPNDEVLCAVTGRGHVIIHERGWRAQYAQVIAVADQVPARVIRAQDGRVLRVVRRTAIDREIMQEISLVYKAPLVSIPELDHLVRSDRGEA